MQQRIDAQIGRRLGLAVGPIARWPGLTILLVLALAGLSLAYTATHLGVNTDTDAMLSDELPIRRAEAVFESEFPEIDKDLLLVVDAPTEEGVREATDALADALQREPELFPSVFQAGGGEFFERHGLLYLDLDELDAFGDRLAKAQPFLGELAADPSLRGLFALLGRALDEEDVVDEADLERVLDRVERAVSAAARDENAPFFFESLVLGDAVDRDARHRIILVTPTIDFTELLAVRAPMDRVHEIFEALGLRESFGARVRITGGLALSTEELEVVQTQAAQAGVLSFVLVTLILFLALRSVRLILATVTTLLVGLILTAGFAALAIGHLNILSVSCAVLFIGLGVDFGIHLCLRYRELGGQGSNHSAALRGAVESVGSSLVLCALTTAIGFYAFAPTKYLGVAELGIISGTGMFISLACSLTLLPALLSVGRDPAGPAVAGGAPRLSLPRFPLRRPREVRVVVALLALAAAVTVPRLHFDANPIAVRDPGSDSVQALRDLLEDPLTSPWGIDALAKDAASADALAARFAALPTVSRTVTLSDLVPQHQEEKREVLSELSFLLALPPAGTEAPPPTPAQVRAALSHFRARVEAAARQRGGRSPPAAAQRLSRALAQLSRDPEVYEARLARLDANLLPPIRAGIRQLERALDPGSVTLETLPVALRERFVSPSGIIRVQAFPSQGLDDAGALERFVDEVQSVAPESVGGAAGFIESGRAIVTALRQALGGAVALIGLVLWLLWRRVTDSLLVLTPLLLAALFTSAASVMFDVPLNFANVIVLPLLLGIGVDSGIHLVHRHRNAPGQEDLLGSSTARGIFFSALTTVASFGSLGFSTHQGLASLGQLLAVGVALTLACNLFVLPALLVSVRKR